MNKTKCKKRHEPKKDCQLETQSHILSARKEYYFLCEDGKMLHCRDLLCDVIVNRSISRLAFQGPQFFQVQYLVLDSGVSKKRGQGRGHGLSFFLENAVLGLGLGLGLG